MLWLLPPILYILFSIVNLFRGECRPWPFSAEELDFSPAVPLSR